MELKTTMCDTPVKITSYNCRGLSIHRNVQSVKNNILKIISERSDIVLLQETWLFKHDLSKLNQFLPNFYGTGVSTTNAADGIPSGHPPGGVAVLWRRELNKVVKPLNLGYDWLSGMSIINDDGNTSLTSLIH